MELGVYHRDGTPTGRNVELEPEVFGAVPNDHVLWLDVRRTQASRRQGTHKTKERSDVRASTRKLYRQKGTGLARSGSRSSPLRRGGGRTFGPRPRTYRLRLSRKTRRLARCSALSYKAAAEAIRVVEPLAFEKPSTRDLLGLVEAFELSQQRILVITEQNRPAVHLSSRNAARIAVREARNVSAEDILRAGVLLMEEGAHDILAHSLRSTKETARS